MTSCARREDSFSRAFSTGGRGRTGRSGVVSGTTAGSTGVVSAGGGGGTVATAVGSGAGRGSAPVPCRANSASPPSTTTAMPPAVSIPSRRRGAGSGASSTTGARGRPSMGSVISSGSGAGRQGSAYATAGSSA